MKYTILLFDSPESLARFDGPDGARYMSEWRPFIRALTDAGVYIAGAGLRPADTATPLRFTDGKDPVQDGPYADTKEQLGGFYMIDVPDLDTALAWAVRTPRLPGQVFEVRPNLAADQA